MLVLNPQRVQFGARVLEDVSLISVDREAVEPLVAWEDGGPHATLVDAPRQKVSVRVVQALTRDELQPPRPGELGELSFTTAPAASAAGGVRCRVRAVVTAVRYTLSAEAGKAAAARREVVLVAEAESATVDPVRLDESAAG